MHPEFSILLITAISIACLHTISGPDHYLPFVAIAKARKWNYATTIFWTVVCGSGHVWSSVALGLLGGLLGWSLSQLSFLESIRGGIAGWALLFFGLLYAVWGFLRARRNGAHRHFDYGDQEVFVYEHQHGEAVRQSNRHKVTPWVLFVIFVLGPCEPMIPLLYFPAAKSSWKEMFLLVGVYTIVTLLSMIAMVTLCLFGIRFLDTGRLERYMHALGGTTIFICGLGMVFLNW